MLRVLKTFFLLLVMASLCDWVFAQEEKKRLIDAIEQSIAIVDAISPYDFVGTAEESKVYGSEVEAEGSYRFRVRVDLDSKQLSFGMDSKSIVDLQVGGPKCSFCRVKDDILRSTRSESEFLETKFSKHREALQASSIPLLSNCSLSDYRVFHADPGRLSKMIAQINQPESNVLINEDDEVITFTLRVTWGEGSAGFHIWKFTESEGRLLEYRIEFQYVEGDARTLALRQTIFWGEFSGIEVPVLIQLESSVGRRKQHPTIENLVENGLYQTDIELKWVSVRQTLKPEPKVDLSRSAGVKMFIEDGLK